MRITSNEYDKIIKELKRKEQDILQRLMDHSKADEQFLITSSYILELANRAYELFESSQAEQKRRLLNFVFANFSAQGSKLQYKIKEPFNELLFASKSSNWLPQLDSNQRPNG